MDEVLKELKELRREVKALRKELKGRVKRDGDTDWLLRPLDDEKWNGKWKEVA